MAANHDHLVSSGGSENHDQPASASNLEGLPKGFPCSLQPDPVQWNEHVIELDQFGDWKLIVLNAEGFHAGNVVILKRRKDLVVIDSGCSGNYKKIIKKIAKQEDSPFFLINTHAHPDHTGANLQMVEEGAIVMAHRNARIHMVGYGLPGERGLPVVTFGRRMSIYPGNQHVNLISLPAGHTDGDLAVRIPELNILHAGDVFMNGHYPLIDSDSGGRILGLIKSVRRMIRMSNSDTVVIPGHGDLANRRRLVQYRNMLNDVTEDVRELKGLGYSLEDVHARHLTRRYDQEWGQGLISGPQFVRFVYNTLPNYNNIFAGHSAAEKRSVHSDGVVSGDPGCKKRTRDRDFESFTLVTGRTTLRAGDDGDVLLRTAIKRAHLNGAKISKVDGLTGVSWSDLLANSGQASLSDFCSSIQLNEKPAKSWTASAGEFLEGRLKGVSPRKKLVELEFVFDADDLSDERYPGLAQNELIELEAVGIGQACACSTIDL